MSTLDENGILIYDETDQRDTFSELLNVGQNATSDAIGADRARLDVLETKDALGEVAAAFTAASGWNLVLNTARKKNGLVFWRIRFTRTGGTITVPADGNIENERIATINAGWHPAAGMNYPATGSDAGPLIGGAVYVLSGTWGIYVPAVAPGVTITNGSDFTLTGVYPLA